MDETIADTFLQATRKVFASMVGDGLEVAASDAVHEYEISGVVGISGDFAGTIILGFPEKTAQQVVKAFAGFDAAGDELNDAVGELTNMVAGSGKATLPDKHLSISLPNVVRGARHTITNARGVTAHVLPCRFRGHPFTVEVRLRPTRA